jgi:hypothetical protein
MTLLVGIYCEDGIVIAADQQATLGTISRPTVGSSVTKIMPIKGSSALYAFSGFKVLSRSSGAFRIRTAGYLQGLVVPAFQDHDICQR